MRRGRVAAAVLAGSALILAGCSGDSGGGTSPTGDTKEDVTFTWAYTEPDSTTAAAEQVISELYMDEHPHVTIIPEPVPRDAYGQNIRTQLQAGSAPDLISTIGGTGEPFSVLPLAEAGFFEPITDATSLATIPDNARWPYEVDGKIYGQPLSMILNVMLVNDDASQAAGIEYPTSMDGVFEACAAAKEAGLDGYVGLAGGAAPHLGLTTMALSAGLVYADTPDWNNQRFAGSTTFAQSEGWRDVLETFVAMADAECFQPGAEGAGFGVLTQAIGSGTILTGALPSNAGNNLTEVTGAAFSTQVLPFDNGPAGFAMPQDAISINASSPVKEAVAEFVAWLAEPENQIKFAEIEGTLPLVGAADANLPAHYDPILPLIVDNLFVPAPNAEWPSAAVYDALCMGAQGLLTGTLTIDQVLENMDQAWDSA